MSPTTQRDPGSSARESSRTVGWLARAPGVAWLTGRVRVTGVAIMAAGCAGDATDRDAAVATQPSEHGAPEIFAPGAVSDGRWQWRITFTPDGATAYYSVSEGWFPATREATIMTSRRQEDGTWAPPEAASFSGIHSDMDPFITPDGRRLYFSSNRPVDGAAREAFDIWYVERTAGGWGDPIRLGPEVNSDSDELYASQSADGTLYFASGPPGLAAGETWNLFAAEPRGAGFAPREALDGVNTPLSPDADDPAATWDFNPEISPDGQVLLFTSLRPGGHGAGDLYVSFLRDGAWTEPRNLGPPVNTEADEYHPTISRDGRTLHFVRAILAPEIVPGNFYSIALDALSVELDADQGSGGNGSEAQ